MSTQNYTHDQIVELLKGLTPEARKQVLADSRGNAKEPRMVVAKRINLRDSSPTAKRVRYEGTIEYLTEKQLLNTLRTWIKRTKDMSADEHLAHVDEQMAKILAGETTFKNAVLEIVGLDAPTPLTDDLPTRV